MPAADQCLGKSEQKLFGEDNTLVLLGSVVLDGMKRPSGPFGSAGLAVCPPSTLSTPAFLLWAHEKQKALMQAAVEKPSSALARPSTNVHLEKSSKSCFIVVCCFYKRGLPVWRTALKKLFLNDFQSLPAESSKG